MVCEIIPNVSRLKSQPLRVDQLIPKDSWGPGQHLSSRKSRITVLKMKCTPGSYKQAHFLWKTLPTNLCAVWTIMFSPVSSLFTAGTSLLQCQRPVVWKREVKRLMLCLQPPMKEGHDVCGGKKITKLSLITNIHQSFWGPSGSLGPQSAEHCARLCVCNVMGCYVETPEAMATKQALKLA